MDAAPNVVSSNIVFFFFFYKNTYTSRRCSGVGFLQMRDLSLGCKHTTSNDMIPRLLPLILFRNKINYYKVVIAGLFFLVCQIYANILFVL